MTQNGHSPFFSVLCIQMEAKLVKEYNELFNQYKQQLMLRAFNRGSNPIVLNAMEEKLTSMKAQILALRAKAAADQTSSESS